MHIHHTYSRPSWPYYYSHFTLTLYHNTVQYNYRKIQYNTVQYNNTIQYCTIQYNSVQYNIITTVKYNTIQYRTILSTGCTTRNVHLFVYIQALRQIQLQYNAIQYNTIPYNTRQYTIQYNTIQYHTIQYNTITVQYNTILYCRCDMDTTLTSRHWHTSAAQTQPLPRDTDTRLQHGHNPYLATLTHVCSMHTTPTSPHTQPLPQP